MKKFKEIRFTPQPMETAPKGRWFFGFHAGWDLLGWIKVCWREDEQFWYDAQGISREVTAWADIPVAEEEE